MKTKKIPTLSRSGVARFWSKVNRAAETGPSGDCWEWTGYHNAQGYGSFGIGSKVFRAHRVAFILENGPIPDGLHVLHTCDNPECVNPDHLWLGTNADNAKDRDNKGRQVTPTGENHGTHTMPESTCRGEKNGIAKLTAVEVLEIRKRYATGGHSQRELAKAYSISQRQIGRVVRGEGWAHAILNRAEPEKGENK